MATPEEIREALAGIDAKVGAPASSDTIKAAIESIEAKLETRESQLTMLEKLDEAAGALGAGFDRGLATLLGLPGELINLAVQGVATAALTPLPEGFPRAPGIAEARRGLEALPGGVGATRGSERTALSRGLGVVGEIAGSSVLPSAGLLAKGAAGTGLVNQLARTAQQAPGKFALQELAGAGGAGAAIQAAREAGVDTPAGELLAGLAGAASWAAPGPSVA